MNPVVLIAIVGVALIVWAVVVAVQRRGQGSGGEAGVPADRRRTALRYAGAGLCGIVAVLYVSFGFVVRTAERESAVPVDEMWPAFLIGAVPFLAGAVVLAIVDLRPLELAGAVVQAAFLIAFFWVGLGALADAPMTDIPSGIWAAAITGLQVLLLVLLGYLAATPEERRPATPGLPTPTPTG